MAVELLFDGHSTTGSALSSVLIELYRNRYSYPLPPPPFPPLATTRHTPSFQCSSTGTGTLFLLPLPPSFSIYSPLTYVTVQFYMNGYSYPFSPLPPSIYSPLTFVLVQFYRNRYSYPLVGGSGAPLFFFNTLPIAPLPLPPLPS